MKFVIAVVVAGLVVGVFANEAKDVRDRRQFSIFAEEALDVAMRTDPPEAAHWGMPRTTAEYIRLQRAFATGEPAAVIRLHAARLAAAAFRQQELAAMSEKGRGE